MSNTVVTPISLIQRNYEQCAARLVAAREALGRSLTYAEKILINHLVDASHIELVRGTSYVDLQPDRVAMQDATAQMALLQFMTAGLEQVAVPTTVHCDHLIRAEHDSDTDLAAAIATNREVYEFLRSVSAKYGIGFWQPGSGIIHQVVLEQYAFPGGVMVGTDSHTPNAGGLGMLAIGVGGADAVDVMVGSPFGLRWPRFIGIELTGKLSSWTSPKDVILHVAQALSVKGGTGAIVEYFGEGVEAISPTGRATICNMGAEVGATTSVFPFDERTAAYLRSTGRTDVANLALEYADDLRADDMIVQHPEQYFDHVLRVDLSALEPQVVGPHTPDLGRAMRDLGAEAEKNGWPKKPSACLVGSCTNSSYEDIARAAHIARQAHSRGIKASVPLLITPGSERTRATVERDGLLADLQAVGAVVLANACGPCIGQWKRNDIENGQTNAILSSYNRNFPKRNDGNASTLSFIASPEVVTAIALSGTFATDPVRDDFGGAPLSPPAGADLPRDGFARTDKGFLAPPELELASDITVEVLPNSERLQLLEPFASWNGEDFLRLPVLLKAQGKCTTDHISAAGPWLRYRGHLENICQNLFLGAKNAFTDIPGMGINHRIGIVQQLPVIAKDYREHNISWIAIGDENYGEGSSREHAAMEPRFMGCKVIIARSFARIHETNLKKQGVLALTFCDGKDYEYIGPNDTISVLNIASLAPGEVVDCVVHHENGEQTSFQCSHTMNHDHIAWFRAGSALNMIRNAQ